MREFGAFVDLGGGVQGLLHVSEMGWSRVDDPSQVVEAGDEITVKVLRVDEDDAEDRARPEAAHRGSVVDGARRPTRSGRCAPAASRASPSSARSSSSSPASKALAHVSTFAPTGRAKGWRSRSPSGTTGAFEILSIDPDKKRIGVALVPEGSRARPAAPSPPVRIVPGARLTGKVERHEKFGVFVFLAPGRTGLMPLSETGLARKADVAKAFPVGSDIEVIVLEADPSGRRIRVSRKAVIDAQEASGTARYTERADAAPAEGFGSLADKLRGAMKGKDS